MTPVIRLTFLSLLAVIGFACKGPAKKEEAKPDRKAEIESALKTYDRLIWKMDADSIADLYMAEGELGDIVHGRDSIRKFLSTFTNVKVLSVASTSEKIVFYQDTAIQNGRYNQTALVNNKDTMRPKGTYEAKWIWIKGEGWKIRRMTTTPE